MEIIEYNYEKDLKEKFIELNLAWINELFEVEEEDKRILSQIDNEVKKGAKIFFACENNQVLSTLMITPIDDDTYELVKFATLSNYKNNGAGKMVLEYAINQAKKLCKRLIIATNTKCHAAIHLYEKYGFKVLNTNNTYGFKRVDICYELVF